MASDLSLRFRTTQIKEQIAEISKTRTQTRSTQHRTESVERDNNKNSTSMSASDLAPFVAAVIEDGIVAEMKNKIEELKHKIEDLESTVQDRDNERLLVQVTGHNGRPIYVEKSLKDGWLWVDVDNVNNDAFICPFDVDDAFICPFDEESIT